MGNCFALKKKQKPPELPEDEKKPNLKKDPKKGAAKEPEKVAKPEAMQEPKEESTDELKEEPKQEPKPDPKMPKQDPMEQKPEPKLEPKQDPNMVPQAQEEEQNELEELINQHQIIVFSKTVCPLSDDAKGILEEEGIDYTLVELDTCEGFSNLENQLGEKSGRECVPVIYVNGQLLGGACELSKAVESGRLTEMLKEKKKSPTSTGNKGNLVRPRNVPEPQNPRRTPESQNPRRVPESQNPRRPESQNPRRPEPQNPRRVPEAQYSRRR